MIHHVWDRVRQCTLLDEVVVATDDERIANYCSKEGIAFVLTSSDHETGTDRVAEVAQLHAADIYVNIQGDEPLINPASIDAVTRCLLDELPRGIGVSTAYLPEASTAQLESTSCVHLVPTLDGCVMTFSRLPIPCPFKEEASRTVHVGLYAFTAQALRDFALRSRGPVERAESIELMRFLEYGDRIACVAVSPGSIGVDHPEDIAAVEAALALQQ